MIVTQTCGEIGPELAMLWPVGHSLGGGLTAVLSMASGSRHLHLKSTFHLRKNLHINYLLVLASAHMLFFTVGPL